MAARPHRAQQRLNGHTLWPVPPINLKDKPIAITGAGTGIGLATAIQCAAAGMPVALAGRRKDKLDAGVEQIKASGGRAIAVVTDVSNPTDCQNLIDQTIEQFGSLYAVYANAGYGVETAVHETSDKAMRNIFETNYFGTLNTIRPALEHMRQNSAGHILICSSAIGKIGIPYYGAYCATKAAQTIIGRSMKHELQPLNIHVTTVHPVLTSTEFAKTAQAHSGGSRIADDMPRFLVQSPDRIASATLRALRRPRTEVWTSTLTRLIFGALIAFPGLADIALGRATRKK